MEGDIPALALRHEFFMGVKVGWHFPEMMKPQRVSDTAMTPRLKSCNYVLVLILVPNLFFCCFAAHGHAHHQRAQLQPTRGARKPDGDRYCAVMMMYNILLLLNSTA